MNLGGKEVVKLLVGNKVDQQRVVQRETADEWARSRGMCCMLYVVCCEYVVVCVYVGDKQCCTQK